MSIEVARSVFESLSSSGFEAAMKIRREAPVVYMEVSCDDEGPAERVSHWVELKLDRERVNQLLRLESVRAANGVDLVGESIDAAWGPSDKELEPPMRDGKVIVEQFEIRGMFHLEAREKYSNGVGKSDYLVLEDFFVRVAKGERYFASVSDMDGFVNTVETDLERLEQKQQVSQ